MLVTSIFSFSHNIFYLSHNKLQFLIKLTYFVVYEGFQLTLVQKFCYFLKTYVQVTYYEIDITLLHFVDFIYWINLTPFLNNPWFLRVCSTSLLKTLWEKEKLLITSNFSIFHSGSYPFGKHSPIFIKFEIAENWRMFSRLCHFGRV